MILEKYMPVSASLSARRYGIFHGARILALLCCLSFILSACGETVRQGGEEPYVVGVVTKSGSSEYWMTLRQGMEAAAAELEMELVVLSPDSEALEEVQSKMVETLINRNVDILAISPIDSYCQPDYFDLADESGIPIISYDTGFDGSDIPYIGIDNYQAGRAMAEYLTNALEHRGEVGIVSGSLEQQSHRQRMEGFVDYMEAEPQMKVVFIESGYSNLQMSEMKIRRIKAAHPSIDGIAATSAVTALGIAEGLEDDAVKIVSIDVQKDAAEALQDGRITALIAQSGYEIGYRTIHYIDRFRRGSVDGSGEILDAEVLTKDNVEAYMEREYQE